MRFLPVAAVALLLLGITGSAQASVLSAGTPLFVGKMLQNFKQNRAAKREFRNLLKSDRDLHAFHLGALKQEGVTGHKIEAGISAVGTASAMGALATGPAALPLMAAWSGLALANAVFLGDHVDAARAGTRKANDRVVERAFAERKIDLGGIARLKRAGIISSHVGLPRPTGRVAPPRPAHAVDVTEFAALLPD